MKPRKPLKRSTKPIAKKSAKKLAHEFAMQGLSDMAFIAHITRNQTPIPKKREKPRRKVNPLDEIFPNENDVKKEPVIEKVFRDGRTKINQLTKAGRDLYQERKRIAWEKQGRLCAICHKPLAWKDSTVDHIAPRGMGAGSIDDRQANLQAVHGLCNSRKGSQRNFDDGLGA